MNLLHVAFPEIPTATGPQNLDLAAVVGDAAWNRLPTAVRRRFAATHEDTSFTGTLSMDCSWIGRLFARASRLVGAPLTCERCKAPARVRVYSDGRGGIVWERHLALPGGEKVVRSTKLVGEHGTLIERTDGGLAMDLEVFEEQGALVFRSHRYFLAAGSRRIPIPGWLTPGTCRVEHHDLGEGRFRFELSMAHPWWGVTFRQSGVFNDPKEIRA